MTTQQIDKQITGAAPGAPGAPLADVLRATEAAELVSANILIEARHLAEDRSRGVRTVEQEQRLEDARRDLDAAEAFESALENGDV
ncbi:MULTISPECIES: hypothetical protein [unclassified Microbacterium]|uniref:hypothetical protein n=1 Tax=unclassified Microbacterium TaxID=2609290 RepID=UPI002882F2E2|nr:MULTISPECIES: hypothetical protein [unclassified Microbacterium]